MNHELLSSDDSDEFVEDEEIREKSLKEFREWMLAHKFIKSTRTGED